MVGYVLTKVNQQRSFKNLSPEIYRTFVTYGQAGLCHGMIRSKKMLFKNNSYVSIIFGPTYYTKKIYDNFKKDKSRILTLGVELSRKGIDQLSQLREYRENLVDEDIELSGRTGGKRKALNNGIFKADDIY